MPWEALEGLNSEVPRRLPGHPSLLAGWQVLFSPCWTGEQKKLWVSIKSGAALGKWTWAPPPSKSLILLSFGEIAAGPLSHVQLSAAPQTTAHQAPPAMGFPRQEYLSGLLCPPPGDLPHPGIKPMFLMSPAWASRFFTTSSTWEVWVGEIKRGKKDEVFYS